MTPRWVLIGGVLVGALAPVLGMFLVLRRFSLIADTLAHVALMGVAVGTVDEVLIEEEHVIKF